MKIKETRDRIQVLTFGQPAYPDLLQQIKDPPKTLYYIGKVELLRSRCVAVVGSRTTTTYGRNIGRGIALCLARHGVTVVSGMAAGIDTCAHEGALQERGPTIAVLGTGPDICYPTENQALKKAHEAYPEARPLYHSDRGFQYTREVFKTKLESYGMDQSMSRVSKCIDNGPCEQFQGQFKDILFILFPDVTTKEEMILAIYKTYDYYINYYPQKRFHGKTAGQVRKEALEARDPISYPIASNPRIDKYWKHIEELKNHSSVQI